MSTKKESSNIPAAQLDLYDKLVKTIPNLERKGATIPYTSVNGHMFSYLRSDGSLALKLPQAARETFLKTFKTHLTLAYGIVQKEYVDVPARLFQDTEKLQPYFAQSFEYVNGLKPKPTKKSKPKTAAARKK